MRCAAPKAFLLILFALFFREAQIRAQCGSTQQLEDHKPRIYYKEHTERKLLSDSEWNRIDESGRTYRLEHPTPSGFLTADFIKRWKFVDTTDVTQRERFSYALIVAVNKSVQSSHVFFAHYESIKKGDLIGERIRKVDLKYYNRILHTESISVDTPSLALDICLLLLQASTHQARGLFIQIINSASEIPQPSDKARRFWGIVHEQSDLLSLAEFRNEIAKLSKTVTPPSYSRSGTKYNLSFFTWDPYSGDVEYWCMSISNSGIGGITRKLISHGV